MKDNEKEIIENPNYYGIIPANVRYDKDLTANAKLLYSELTCLSHKEGFCFSSNNYFAKLYDVTPQAISKWINQLAEKGYVRLEYIYEEKVIVQRRIYINTVSININTVSTKVSGGINKGLIGYKQKVKDNNTSINNININNINNIKSVPNKKSNSKSCLFDRIKEYTQNEELRNSLNKYLQFKLSTRKGFTLDQWNILLEDLARYAHGNDQKAIVKVNSSYAKGYQAIVYENEIEKDKDSKSSYYDSRNIGKSECDRIKDNEKPMDF